MISADALNGAALKARISRDLGDLSPGQRGALIHVRFAQAINPSQPADQKLVRALEAELPAKAMLEAQDSGSVAVWVPRTSEVDATTIARVLRRIALQHKTPDDSAEHQFPTERQFALGVVLVDHPNWEHSALLGTAEVTSAMALLAGVHQVRFAQQIHAKP